MSLEQILFVNNALQLAAIIVLCYDHCLTLPQEIQYMWRRPGRRVSASTVLFFINRYLATFGYIGAIPFAFINLEFSSCFGSDLYHICLLFVGSVVVSLVMVFRTYALYNKDRRILAALVVIGLSVVVVAIWGSFAQDNTLNPAPLPGCHFPLMSSNAAHYAIAWESLLAFDTIVFGLTIFRTWRLSRGRKTSASGRVDVVGLMLRDGATYYAVMAAANSSNLATFYLLNPYMRGALSTMANLISVTMCSRMFLNLHERAHRLRRHSYASSEAPMRPTAASMGARPTADSSLALTEASFVSFDDDSDIQDPVFQPSLLWGDEMPMQNVPRRWMR